MGRQTIIEGYGPAEESWQFDADAEYLDEDLKFTPSEVGRCRSSLVTSRNAVKKREDKRIWRFKLFLAQNAVKAENVKHVVSRRFG